MEIEEYWLKREEIKRLFEEIDSGKYDEIIARCLEDANKV